MATHKRAYRIADGAGLRAWLRGSLAARASRLYALSRSFYDTPDRRLHRAGWVLEEQARRGQRRLVLRELAGSRALTAEDGIAVPRFAKDLPPGELRDALAALAGTRVLLPVARVRSRITPLTVLDKHGQVGLKLEIDAARLAHGGRAEDQPLGCWLRLAEDGGPRKLRERVAALIESHPGVEPIEGPAQDLFEVALAAGPAPAALARPRVELAPSIPAARAVAEVLGAYFRTLTANEAGVIDALDSEFLHDLRVALRASRSVLNRLREVFPQREHEKARSDLAWLGEVTGAKRDLDVFLLELEGYAVRLPPSWQPHLEPLRVYLRELGRAEHERLVQSLRSERYLSFKRDYPAWLAQAARRRPREGAPAEQIASRAIWRAYHELLSEGFAVMEDTPIEALHELRKTCKKLRYLIEAFQSLYRADPIRQVVGALKRLQDSLGSIVDRDVQRRLSRRFGDELSARGPVPDETRVAIQMIDALLEQEERVQRATFDASLEHFARPRHRRLFRALFAPEPAGVAGAAKRRATKCRIPKRLPRVLSFLQVGCPDPTEEK